ncbi:SOS response-associated peptidase [Pseudanabaena sp. FACHB-2040]|uniref:SOS response-associated peptidase n=1 Tax=Pseudanabaena sp. FACHB-2040 TaxID=2692859 RepID=UPI0016886481|nr:SOS response-associated peptidase [Pseudanabaena sp. FACHB-2040]MBD2257094.1 SOS response-associated peptidase [Pseudanabaena sp. FACHB-2040]
MCGRFTQSQSGESVAQAFQLKAVPNLQPRYNIAPTQPVSAILATPDSPEPRYQLLRWGLIPSWAKDSSIGSRLINARSETVAEKPSFRAAFKRRRCLIVADGFYEWKSDPNSKAKQPYYFRLKEHAPFAFAGLWEQWTDPQSGSELDTCTILTTAANAVLEPVHDRMPVILEPDQYAAWLDPDFYDPKDLQTMLDPYRAEGMESYPVSKAVNSPRNDAAECLEPVEV